MQEKRESERKGSGRKKEYDKENERRAVQTKEKSVTHRQQGEKLKN